MSKHIAYLTQDNKENIDYESKRYLDAISSVLTFVKPCLASSLHENKIITSYNRSIANKNYEDEGIIFKLIIKKLFNKEINLLPLYLILNIDFINFLKTPVMKKQHFTKEIISKIRDINKEFSEHLKNMSLSRSIFKISKKLAEVCSSSAKLDKTELNESEKQEKNKLEKELRSKIDKFFKLDPEVKELQRQKQKLIKKQKQLAKAIKQKSSEKTPLLKEDNDEKLLVEIQSSIKNIEKAIDNLQTKKSQEYLYSEGKKLDKGYNLDQFADQFQELIKIYYDILKNKNISVEHKEELIRPLQDVSKLKYLVDNNPDIRKKIKKLEHVANDEGIHAEHNLLRVLIKEKGLKTKNKEEDANEKKKLDEDNDQQELHISKENVKSLDNYFGTSKLACGYCHYVLENGYEVKSNDSKSDNNISVTSSSAKHNHRGTHGVYDPKWKPDYVRKKIKPILDQQKDNLKKSNDNASELVLQHRRLSYDAFEEKVDISDLISLNQTKSDSSTTTTSLKAIDGDMSLKSFKKSLELNKYKDNTISKNKEEKKSKNITLSDMEEGDGNSLSNRDNDEMSSLVGETASVDNSSSGCCCVML